MRTINVLPVKLHVLIQALLGIFLVVAPFVLDTQDDSFLVAASIVLGALLLVLTLVGDTRIAATRLLPMRAVEGFDYTIGIALVLLPLVAGATDDGAVTLTYILCGLILIVATMATRFPHTLGDDSKS